MRSNAFYQSQFGVRMDASAFGAAFFIPTAVVPPLLVTHGPIFWLHLASPSFSDLERRVLPTPRR